MRDKSFGGSLDPWAARGSAGSEAVDGPAKGQAVMDQWERMLDVWYETVGYDRRTGKPLPETLKRLGLDELARDLWGA